MFEKPWILNLFMSFGMLCGIINYLILYQINVRSKLDRNGLLEGKEPPKMFAWYYNLVGIPGLMDIIGSVLIITGLKYAAASIYVMMRSFTLLCTAVLSVTYLKKKLYHHN